MQAHVQRNQLPCCRLLSKIKLRRHMGVQAGQKQGMGTEGIVSTCYLRGKAALHKHTTVLSKMHKQAKGHCCRRVNHAAKYQQQLNALLPLLSVKLGQSAQTHSKAQHEPLAGERLAYGAICLLFCLLASAYLSCQSLKRT